MAETALRELADDAASRKKFLKMVGAGGAGALAMLIAACGDDGEPDSTSGSGTPPMTEESKADSGIAQFGEGDLGIANYALTLEYLEADFYAQAAASGMLKGQALELGKQFGEHEAMHVDALEKMIKQAGGKLPDKPKGKFPLDSQDAILELASTVENLGAAAYLGQAPAIQDKEILAAALSIHSVEARHASALNVALGKSPTPDGAFAKPATAEEVLKQVQPLIAS